MYTRFEDERAIFWPAARFCPAPGGIQGAHIEQKQDNSDRARACGRNGENSDDACTRVLRASGPFFGPVQAFPPPGAPRRAPISSEKMKLRTSSRTQHKWSKIRRCVYTRFQHEQTFFEVAGGFGPGLGASLVRQLLISKGRCASPSS
jgi:hypothetical protein